MFGIEFDTSPGAPSKLDQFWSKLMFTTRPYVKQPGDGTRRAAARMKAKRKANKLIPVIARPPSRQATRRSQILRGRQIVTIARKELMARKLPGGSAVLRNPVDVDRLLG